MDGEMMLNLNEKEIPIIVFVLERALASMEEYDKGHYSTSEDLLIGMDDEDMSLCKSAIEKLKAGN